MLCFNFSKKVALGTITTAAIAASVLFFIVLPTAAQSGGEKSKSAWNVTQGRNAEAVDARPGDIIEYTLEFRNTDSSYRSVRIEDNISDVLKLSTIEDRGGAQFQDSTLRWNTEELARDERATRRFRVRVLTPTRSSSDLTMTNTYGNTVRVRVRDEGRVDGLDVSKSKTAYNVTRGQDAEATNARPGDIIEYRLQVRNTDTYGNEITIEDDIADLNDLSDLLSVSDNGERYNDTLRWRNVYIGAGQTVTRTFRVRIKEDRYLDQTSDRNMINTFGNSVDVRVSRDGSNYYDYYYDGYNTTRSVFAYNNTQGRDAEGVYARPNDIITFTLSYRNDSGTNQYITIESDVTDVQYLAEVINYGGGRIYGSNIRFDSINVPAYSRIDRSFQVRVRSVASGTTDKVMSMSYGNGVDIYVASEGTAYSVPPKGTVSAPSVPYKAPATGTSENIALGLAGLITLGAYLVNRKRQVFSAENF